MIDRQKLPYRKSTLGVISDKEWYFLVVNKIVYKDDQWAFPGGGVDEGETALEAVKRELVEELLGGEFEVIAESMYPFKYEWPDDVVEEIYKKRGLTFRGTELVQFWVKFKGERNNVKPGDGLRGVKWVKREELKSHLVFPNQWENAERVIEEFCKLER